MIKEVEALICFFSFLLLVARKFDKVVIDVSTILFGMLLKLLVLILDVRFAL